MILGIFSTIGQIMNPTEEFALPASLSESSGLIFFNDKLITHNDSGGQNELYELDIDTELVTRTVTITNATNIDWEDITQDDTHIYVADIGNNYGSRTNLVIYKISKTAYLASTSVTAEIIEISYFDQTDFTPNLNNNEWDAEALVSYDATNLLLFTKNWVDGITKAYVIPKTQGVHSISPLTTSLDSGGRITGGTFNSISGKLYLVGYTPILIPFVWVSDGFTNDDIFSGTNTQTSLSTFSFEQTEGITYVDEDDYFISSESFNNPPFSDYAKLISFTTNDVSLSIEELITEKDVIVYPNPTKDFLHIENETILSIELYNTNSVKLFSSQNSIVDMRDLAKGVYFLKINFEKDVSILKKIIKQ
jgi:hypothetical protein